MEIEFVCLNCKAVNRASVDTRKTPIVSGQGDQPQTRFVQCRVQTCLVWNKLELPSG